MLIGSSISNLLNSFSFGGFPDFSIKIFVRSVFFIFINNFSNKIDDVSLFPSLIRDNLFAFRNNYFSFALTNDFFC